MSDKKKAKRAGKRALERGEEWRERKKQNNAELCGKWPQVRNQTRYNND